MAKKKYYAVVSGLQPGIYDNWPAAQAQVKGYPGAVFKGFATEPDAKDWLQNPVAASPSAKAKKRDVGGVASVSPKIGEVTIYTDGGSINNPGPGGYGAVLIYGDEYEELTGGFRLTTNNRMELMGCIAALQNLPWPHKAITLYSDSSYVVNGISKGWARNWRKNGWIKSDKKPAVNSDLWELLLDLVEKLRITFRWVKGHAGNPMNERCDKLAVAAARQKGLPVDQGYEVKR
jgi:ribonuclease HI